MSIFTRPIVRIIKEPPLKLVLVVPFILQIFAAVGLTGYLSLRNGQKAVENLAAQLRSDITARIQQKLETDLKIPHRINLMNVEFYRQRAFDLKDLQSLEQHFWRQGLLSPELGTIAVATEGGELVGANRSENYIVVANAATDRTLKRYEADKNGRPTQLILEKSDYDPRQRSWYRRAIESGKPMWTPIDRSASSNRLDLSAVYPFYDARQNRQGVFSIDISLSAIGHFLRELEISSAGQAFILEPTGDIVASSTLKKPFVVREDRLYRINSLENKDTLTGAVAQQLQQEFGQLSRVSQIQKLTVNWNDRSHFVQVTPFSDEFGLNWLIVVTIPETDLMGQFHANTRTTLILCAVSLLVATIVGLVTNYRVTRPIWLLSQASKNIARGAGDSQFQESIEEISRGGKIHELVVLFDSFNQMALQLKNSWSELERSNIELEKRVEQRTASLAEAEAEMRALFTAMKEFIFVKDANGRYLKVASTDPRFVYKTHDLIGKTEYDVFSRERADLFLSYIREALETQQTVNAEYQIISQGKKLWFSATISPILEGRPQNSPPTVIWVARDITEQKLAKVKLEEQEHFLRLIIEHIPQQIFWKDANLVFKWCNRNWAEAAQLKSPEDAIGKTDYDLLSDRQMARQFREADRRIIETDTPELHVQAIKQKPGKNGQKIWLDINKIPIHDAQKNVIGILGVLEDITARKVAEEKSEKLLLNILPAAIVEQLKQNTHPDLKLGPMIAEQFEAATILFADIVGFTPLSSQMPATELVNLLNHIFSAFDRLAERHGIEKIKTIGDAYMAVGGVPVPGKDHAKAIAYMALDMQQVIACFQPENGQPINIRIGIHSGPVVAGVIGVKKFSYDLWGDTVNVASRMESSGQPGKIQVTEATYQILKDRFLFETRGEIEVKGKGLMTTYWLLGLQKPTARLH
ncbi:MAG: adenylate/guanylate cyclase domain-containing protein [Geitlerinemataceae cyanobacterium]